MRPLRILFAGYLPPHSGGSATVHNIVLNSLAARGHAIRSIAPITPADAGPGDWFADAHPNLRIRRFEVPFFISATTTAHPAELDAQRDNFQRLIARACASEVPDVLLLGDIVVTHAGRPPGPAGIPSVMFVHGGALYRLRLGAGNDPEWAAMFDRYRRVDHLIAVAYHQGPYLDDLGLTHYSIVPNIVDTQDFTVRAKSAGLLAELGIAAADIVVAHFSNLRRVKRPLDFVEAAAIALRRDARLLFIASGSGELRGAVESRCAQLGISERFRFPGWIRSDLMPEYYSICDAVAMPSESEGRSMVQLETMASGRVLIASDIPASREVVRDGVTGILFPVGSPDELAKCILSVAADPSLRREIGCRARRAVEAQTLAGYSASMERTLTALVERPRVTGAGIAEPSAV